MMKMSEEEPENKKKTQQSSSTASARVEATFIEAARGDKQAQNALISEYRYFIRRAIHERLGTNGHSLLHDFATQKTTLGPQTKLCLNERCQDRHE